MEILFGALTSRAVSALAKLAIPDYLDAGPKSAAELAAATGAR
jgi:hypothetical protein